ncbi:uncharacterized protein [Ptychodera flava]|uniref:uncharacterized protein isoform X2 n=1 Tax=Ptychodera flava TaxID=63121 RepID=UPI00396A22B8
MDLKKEDLGHFDCPKLAVLPRLDRGQREVLNQKLLGQESDPETQLVPMKRNAVRNLRGVVVYLLGDRNAALRIFKQILSSDSKNLNALLNVKRIYHDDKGDKKAEIIRHLESICKGSDSYGQATSLRCKALALFELNVASVYLDQGIFSVDSALDSYRNAIDIARKSGFSHLPQWTFELAYCCYLFVVVTDLIPTELPKIRESEYLKESIQLFHEIRESTDMGALSWLFLGILISRRENWKTLIQNAAITKEVNSSRKCFRKAIRLAKSQDEETIENIIDIEENRESFCRDNSNSSRDSFSTSSADLPTDVVADAAPSYKEYTGGKVKDQTQQETQEPMISETPDSEADNLISDMLSEIKQKKSPEADIVTTAQGSQGVQVRNTDTTTSSSGIVHPSGSEGSTASQEMPVSPEDCDSGIVVTGRESIADADQQSIQAEQEKILANAEESSEHENIRVKCLSERHDPDTPATTSPHRQETLSPSQSSSTHSGDEKHALPGVSDETSGTDDFSLDNITLSPDEVSSLSEEIVYYDVFMLASKQDKDKMDELVDLFESWDLKVHLEEDFTGGRSRFRNVDSALNYSSYVVVVLTKDFLNDKWCEKHIHTSLVESLDDPEKHDYVVPISFGVEDKEVPSELKSISCLRPSNRFYKRQLQKTLSMKKRMARESKQREMRESEVESLKIKKREKLWAKERMKKEQQLMLKKRSEQHLRMMSASEDHILRQRDEDAQFLKQDAKEIERMRAETERARSQLRKHEELTYTSEKLQREIKEKEKLQRLQREIEAKQRTLQDLDKQMQDLNVGEPAGMDTGKAQPASKGNTELRQGNPKHLGHKVGIEGKKSLLHSTGAGESVTEQPIVKNYYITAGNVQIGDANVINELQTKDSMETSEPEPDIEYVFVPRISPMDNSEGRSSEGDQRTVTKSTSTDNESEASRRSEPTSRFDRQDCPGSGGSTNASRDGLSSSKNTSMYRGPPSLKSTGGAPGDQLLPAGQRTVGGKTSLSSQSQATPGSLHSSPPGGLAGPGASGTAHASASIGSNSSGSCNFAYQAAPSLPGVEYEPGEEGNTKVMQLYTGAGSGNTEYPPPRQIKEKKTEIQDARREETHLQQSGARLPRDVVADTPKKPSQGKLQTSKERPSSS